MMTDPPQPSPLQTWKSQPFKSLLTKKVLQHLQSFQPPFSTSVTPRQPSWVLYKAPKKWNHYSSLQKWNAVFCLVLHLHPDVQYFVGFFFGWHCTLTQWFNFFIAGPISTTSSYPLYPNEKSFKKFQKMKYELGQTVP